MENAETIDREEMAKKLFFIYAVFICFLLGFFILKFIGLPKYGSPKIPFEKLKRISHLGYYVSPEGKLVLTGKAEKDSFIHPSLLEGERIVMRPKWNKDFEPHKSDLWIVEYDNLRQPLRFNGRCINLPDNCWFNSGDTLVITYQDNIDSQHYISVRWEDEISGPFNKKRNSFFFNMGTFRNQQQIPQFNPRLSQDVLLTEKMLREGICLYSLIKLCKEQEFPKIGIPSWWEIAKKVKFIRQIKGNALSPMGVLIPAEFFTKPEYSSHFDFYRLSGNICQKLKYKKDGSQQIPFETKICYGFGQKNILYLSLTDSMTEKTIFRNIVEIKFNHPQSWPNQPGFNESKREFKIGGTIGLGDTESGVLLSLNERQAVVPYTGAWALFFLILFTVIFCFLLIKEKKTRLRLDLAWTLIWGLILTILTVRLLLAYRVSLAPPDDATPLELSNIFYKSLKISFWSFLLVPFLLLLIRYISIKWDVITEVVEREKNSLWDRERLQKEKTWETHLLIYIILFAIFIAAARILSESESFLRVMNVIALVAIISGLALFAENVLDSDSKRYFIIFAAFLILSPIYVSVVVGDYGFLIYCIPLCICILITKLSGMEGLKKVVWGMIAVIVITGFSFVIPHIIKLPFLQKAVHPQFPDNIFYRLPGFKTVEEEILFSRSDKSEISMNMLLNNSQRNWQMLHYAAEGSAGARGYGKAPISGKGISYPTAMSDCVYSILILSEFGRGVGIILILIYILLGGACLYGGCSFPTDYKHRLIPLTAIGTFFIYNALYMACANLGLVVFIGQNLPFLGLYSLSDLVQGSVLLVFVVFLLRQGLDASASGNTPAVSITLLTFVILGSLIVFPGLLLRMNHMAEQESPYRKDFKFNDQLQQDIENNLPGQDYIKNLDKPLGLDGDMLVYESPGKLYTIEKIFKEQFNRQIDKFNVKNLGQVEILQKNDGKNIYGRFRRTG
ncbi:MAG: hypothetical protein MUF15_18240, partial [Acidobacteria bacterium]|nr:hypothetical protein [Acidobacteriota bacterium]